MEEFIAAKVPNNLKANWKVEADQWRLPYWDFARKVTLDNSTAPKGGASHQDTLRLPILCMMPSLMVQGFEGENVRLRKMSNPLYKFETPQPMGQGDERYLIEEQVVNPSRKEDSKGFTYPVSQKSHHRPSLGANQMFRAVGQVCRNHQIWCFGWFPRRRLGEWRTELAASEPCFERAHQSGSCSRSHTSSYIAGYGFSAVVLWD